MAEYRTIKMSFWTDPFIEELSAEGKLLYIYLFTCPHANNLGILEISLKRIAYETSLPMKTVTSLISEMESANKIMRDGNLIWLANFIKNQGTTSPLLLKSLKKELESVQSAKMRHAICLRYPHVFECGNNNATQEDTDTDSNGNDTMPGGYLDDTQNVGNGSLKIEGEVKREGEDEKELEREEEKETVSPTFHGEQYLEYVSQFQHDITAVHGNTAPEITDALIREGASTLDKVIRIDGFDFDEVKQALAWSKTDTFWSSNVLSIAQLRKKSKSNGFTKIQNLVRQYRASLIQKVPKQGTFLTEGERREANNRAVGERVLAMMEEQKRRAANAE